jgi:hypothetical protein
VSEGPTVRIASVPYHLDDGKWYHGSPEVLAVLSPGSTVTRCRAAAEAFSHKPTWVSIKEEAGGVRVTHDGTRPGYLYIIAEPVGDSDLHPHPNSAYGPGGLEWITDRPLRLRLVAELPVSKAADQPD